MELSNKKTVLITGAAGFIGLNIVKSFLKQGFKVCAMIHENYPEELKNIGAKVIKADIKSRRSVLWALLDFKPQILVHAAGISSDIGSDEIFREVNFEPIKYLAKIPTEKIIYISSTDVYGIKDFNCETEEELPFEEHPINPYPKYKILSEKWLEENLDKSKYVIIRPAAVFGCGDLTLEKRFLEFLKASPFVFHFGKWKGKNRWPLACVTRLADCVVKLAEIDEYNGQAINIIDDKRTSIDEYYREVLEKNFPNKRVIFVNLPLWVGKILGSISTFLSNFLQLKKPLFDPTYYAVCHMSSNLDFSSAKLNKILNS